MLPDEAQESETESEKSLDDAALVNVGTEGKVAVAHKKRKVFLAKTAGNLRDRLSKDDLAETFSGLSGDAET